MSLRCDILAPVFVNNVQLVEWESRDLSSIVVMSHISSVDYAGWHLPCYAVHNCPRRLQGCNSIDILGTSQNLPLIKLQAWSFYIDMS